MRLILNDAGCGIIILASFSCFWDVTPNASSFPTFRVMSHTQQLLLMLFRWTRYLTQPQKPPQRAPSPAKLYSSTEEELYMLQYITQICDWSHACVNLMLLIQIILFTILQMLCYQCSMHYALIFLTHNCWGEWKYTHNGINCTRDR